MIYDEQPWRDGLKVGDPVVIQTSHAFEDGVVDRLTPKQILIKRPNALGDLYFRAFWKRTGEEVGSRSGHSYYHNYLRQPSADIREHVFMKAQQRRLAELRDKLTGIGSHRFPSALELEAFNNRIADAIGHAEPYLKKVQS